MNSLDYNLNLILLLQSYPRANPGQIVSFNGENFCLTLIATLLF